MSRRSRVLLAIWVPLLIWAMPTSWIPIAGMSVVEHRLLAIFAMAVLLWILEPIPVWATSVLVIVTQLVLISDRGCAPFCSGMGTPGFGELLSYRDIMATFASPVIMLFVGGFFLALAATKYRLDTNLARVFLRPFGRRPAAILLGLMLITAVFSMFMSNTATTAMMLAILTPVLRAFAKNDPGRTAFVLGIPFAANVGGIGTPIGTPPNAVALQYLTGDNAIGFGAWMGFAVPYVLVMLGITWVLLLRAFRPHAATVSVDIRGSFMRTRKAGVVYVTAAATILLWLTDTWHGMNSYVVAMLPVGVFAAAGVVTAEDLRRLHWDVLWLVAGGIALGMALQRTGLAAHLVASVPFGSFPPHGVVVLASLVALGLASLASHTATANLVLPIAASVGAALPGLVPLGGEKMLVLTVTLACSLAMPLPISTPPNAMAYATGMVQSQQMARVGILVGLIGLVGVFALMSVLHEVGFL